MRSEDRPFNIGYKKVKRLQYVEKFFFNLLELVVYMLVSCCRLRLWLLNN